MTSASGALQRGNSKIRVVALGDSFASGEGTYLYEANTDRPPNFSPYGWNTCHRSPLSWQARVTLPGYGAPYTDLDRQITKNKNIDFVFKSCSGAIAKDVYGQVQDVATFDLGPAPTISGRTDRVRISIPQAREKRQIDWLNGAEDYVLLSIGGNDAGFVEVVTACMTSHCATDPLVTGADDRIDNHVLPEIEKAVRAISAKSPGAQIVLVGYPQLVRLTANSACAGSDDDIIGIGFTAKEGELLDGLARTLSDRTAKLVGRLAANGIDITFVPTVDEFAVNDERHGACSGADQWLNSILMGALVWRSPDPRFHPEMFHPNIFGQAAYIRAVNKVLGTN